MNVPSFLKLKDNSLLFNEDGEFLFYVPETYFGETKNPIAQIIGQYVTTLGILDWAIVSKNGTVGEAHPFKFPTIFMCKPDSIEKVKNLKLNNTKGMDYRILHFKMGDEVISDIHVPQIIDNVMSMFGMAIINGNKLPNTIPYDKLHEYFPEAMELNGSGYGLNMQLFGIMISESCRNPKDISEPFRYTKINNMTDYNQVSIKAIPKYISPYVALASETFDESLMAAVLLSDDDDPRVSPLEKVVMS